MEKIILVQVGASEERQIRQLAENKKIRLASVGAEAFGQTVQQIVEGKTVDSLSSPEDSKLADGTDVREKRENLPLESLMIFSEVSEKHFDKILFEMRSRKIHVDYKAVVTPTNRTWTLEQLFAELEREKLFYHSRGI